MKAASPCILDCDPGIDDTLAILHAMGSPNVDLKAITLTYGNTNIRNVTKNLFTILHILGKEVHPVRLATLPPGPNRDRLERIRTKKPVISVGTSEPLVLNTIFGEDFHGPDGLGRLHLDDPDLAPLDWEEILKQEDPEGLGEDVTHVENVEKLYTLSKRHACDEILHQLAQAEPNTITIIAVGPLSNLALAYEKDPITFARCKRVICMGGSLYMSGNVTPVAEFNFHACPHAVHNILQATVNEDPAKAIKLFLLPTDVTTTVNIESAAFKKYVAPLDTPLAKFSTLLMGYLFNVLETRLSYTSMSLHDPLCIGFFIDLEQSEDDEGVEKLGWSVELRDIRVESEGALTRGMVVIDQRKKFTMSPPGSHSRTHVVLKADSERYLRSLFNDIWGISNFSSEA